MPTFGVMPLSGTTGVGSMDEWLKQWGQNGQNNQQQPDGGGVKKAQDGGILGSLGNLMNTPFMGSLLGNLIQAGGAYAGAKSKVPEQQSTTKNAALLSNVTNRLNPVMDQAMAKYNQPMSTESKLAGNSLLSLLQSGPSPYLSQAVEMSKNLYGMDDPESLRKFYSSVGPGAIRGLDQRTVMEQIMNSKMSRTQQYQDALMKAAEEDRAWQGMKPQVAQAYGQYSPEAMDKMKLDNLMNVLGLGGTLYGASGESQGTGDYTDPLYALLAALGKSGALLGPKVPTSEDNVLSQTLKLGKVQ